MNASAAALEHVFPYVVLALIFGLVLLNVLVAAVVVLDEM